ncbi:heme oxygenase [Bradyrhizobium sp. SSBR45G]|uniref:biliverdin-producing heme oxygenase n=1 Tax=unclassified Bradyrhizobium TaxID=2631580 RepID=UPI00234298D0|nr:MULTISPECIES: biliverdin-producing heme oxygenase [unclassified Bradyrhizobium]GLH81744.1 heme oxygenase [Bradyrhizobium sp. SSBR45G]GLH89136.1 heme oxygenase [Bradyrhizobium sp. SSBR45R]
MLDRVDQNEMAGRSTRPASLLEAMRERTKALHVTAERTGIVAELLRGRGTVPAYALLLRNLLPVYEALEAELLRHEGTPVVGGIVRPQLHRSAAIKADLAQLDASDLPRLPEAIAYVRAIQEAGSGSGHPLLAHAYTRYLGDLSGGQIIKKILARSLDLQPEALSFYEFPAIADIPHFKDAYRAALEQAGAAMADHDAVVEEAATAFQLNIALSQALQATAGLGI